LFWFGLGGVVPSLIMSRYECAWLPESAVSLAEKTVCDTTRAYLRPETATRRGAAVVVLFLTLWSVYMLINGSRYFWWSKDSATQSGRGG